MNTLSAAERTAVLTALVEGNSIRAVSRMTGVAKGTILKLLVEAGEFASLYQHFRHQQLPCTRIEADEIWAFCGAKQRNAQYPGQGDIWTYTGICADTKLAVSWLVGARTPENATEFMQDIAARLVNRVQLTTDGHGMYLTAVRRAFAFGRVDYAQLVKEYGQVEGIEGVRRYSPPVCIGATKVRMIGRPNPDLISTSYVERANLTMRMQMRRFTRLTNAFSKKAENHAAAVSLHFIFYNYCRPHQTLTKLSSGIKTTPAMAAGLANRVWTVADLVRMMDTRNLVTSN